MDISFTCSDKYKKPALVMLDSFFKNNSGNHNFHFLYSMTSLKTRSKLKKIIEKNGCNFIEYKIDENVFNGFNNYARFGFIAYYRILLPFILDAAIKKVLWLDTDIVVNGSLSDILDGSDNYSIYGVNYPEEERLNALNLDNKIYVNSGVLIFNLDKIRNEYSKEFLLNSFINNQNKFIYLDQCFFNYQFKNDIGLLEKKYNTVVYRVKKMSTDQLISLNDEACVAHYVGKIKPWNFLYDNRGYKLYWKYAKKIYGNIFYSFWFVVSHLLYCLRPLVRVIKNRRKS